jgi:hypothetical protein
MLDVRCSLFIALLRLAGLESPAHRKFETADVLL